MVIALLTDFGSKDYFAAAMKGVILRINPVAMIVDITHEIPAHDIRSGCFTLSACYKDFPSDSIFAAVVDPGVGSARRAIIVEFEEQKFVAPDNGLLSFILEKEIGINVFEIDEERFKTKPVSSTFHGRDIFAPVAAKLSAGATAKSFGKEIFDYVRIDQPRSRNVSETQIKGQILHIDSFGNLITNIKNNDLPARFCVDIHGRNLTKVLTYYAEAESGELFLIAGSAGYYEIVMNQGSAQNALSAQTNDTFTVDFI